jgi:hypothetical protein
LEKLVRGMSVKVGVPLIKHNSAEWFWVEIVDKQGDGSFVATVRNQLTGDDADLLQRGDRIRIKRDHVLTIYDAKRVQEIERATRKARKAAIAAGMHDPHEDSADSNIRYVCKCCAGLLHMPTPTPTPTDSATSGV